MSHRVRHVSGGGTQSCWSAGTTGISLVCSRLGLGRHPLSAVPAEPHVAGRWYRRTDGETLFTFSVRGFDVAETFPVTGIEWRWLIQLAYAALLPSTIFELGFSAVGG
jgi:hypothetical protein